MCILIDNAHLSLPYEFISFNVDIHNWSRGRSRQLAIFSAYFANHRRLLSNMKFHLSSLSFSSHTISHLLNKKYGIKRNLFFAVSFFVAVVGGEEAP